MALQRKMHLGIDLIGTTVIVIAEYRKYEETRIIARFPAVMNLDTGATGFEAIEETKTSPQDRIFEAKKFLGTTTKEAALIASPAQHPYEMDGSGFKSTAGKTFRPGEVSAKLLQKIKKLFPNEDLVTVITVPAYFKDAQRQATKDAATIAGLELIDP